MARLKARWRLLALVLAAGLLVTGAVAAVAAQTSSPVLLPTISADRLIASTFRAMAAGRPISGHVTAHVDLGLPSLPTEGLPNLPGGAAEILSSLSGDHALRVWHSADGVRLNELLPMSERSLVVNKRAAWFWDFSSFTAYVLRRPTAAPTEPLPIPDPLSIARMALRAITPSTAVSVGREATVAGRPAYVLGLEPRTSATLVRLVEIDIDAATRLPIRVAAYARGRDTAPLSAAFTQVSFDRIDPATFRFSPPPGAKVRNVTPRGLGGGGGGGGFGSSAPLQPSRGTTYGPGMTAAGPMAGGAPRVFGKGWASVIAIRTPSLTQLREQVAGFDLTRFLPFSGPLLSIRLVDRGDHGWLVYGLVPQATLAALENRLH